MYSFTYNTVKWVMNRMSFTSCGLLIIITIFSILFPPTDESSDVTRDRKVDLGGWSSRAGHRGKGLCLGPKIPDRYRGYWGRLERGRRLSIRGRVLGGGALGRGRGVTAPWGSGRRGLWGGEWVAASPAGGTRRGGGATGGRTKRGADGVAGGTGTCPGSTCAGRTAGPLPLCARGHVTGA